MGDLVQIYQACLEFKKQYPDVLLKLIARERFTKSLNFLLSELFDEITHVPSHYQENSSFEESVKKTTDFISTINEDEIDVLINFSFCETSNYLSSVINSKHKLGTRINEHNEVVIHDQWSQVIHALVQRGPYCPFNLVDLFKNILGLKPTASSLEVAKHKGEKTLAVHPFASHSKKKWKEHKWTEVIYNFLKSNPSFKVSLYGAKDEVSSSKKIIDHVILSNYKERIINNVGQLNLEETYKSLSSCHSFLGHDSLLGHLSKVAGLPSLTIALGTVREIETIPYGNNSYVVSPRTQCYPCFPDAKCDDYKCHADIPYQVVCTSIDLLVKEGTLHQNLVKKNISPFHLNSTSISKSEISSHGWLYLENISGHSATVRDIMRTLYRMCFSYQFENYEESFPNPEIGPQSLLQLENIQDGIKQLYELSEFGKKYSKYILSELTKDSPSIEAIQTYSNKIDDIDKLSELIKKTHKELTPLIEYYMVTKSNLAGDGLVQITESSYLVYSDQANSCSIIHELINSISNSKKSAAEQRRNPRNDRNNY